MEALDWIRENFAAFLNGFGIVGGLIFTAFSIRAETRERKLTNLIALTEAHRDIWSRLYEKEELARILQREIDLLASPPTEKEEIFMTSLILHLYCVFRAIHLGMYPELEGLRTDIREFYSLPIPKLVWRRLRALQDRDFVAFVEGALRRNRRRRCRMLRSIFHLKRR